MTDALTNAERLLRENCELRYEATGWCPAGDAACSQCAAADALAAERERRVTGDWLKGRLAIADDSEIEVGSRESVEQAVASSCLACGRSDSPPSTRHLVYPVHICERCVTAVQGTVRPTPEPSEAMVEAALCEFCGISDAAKHRNTASWSAMRDALRGALRAALAAQEGE